ncbi:MAG: helix-turn-helix domain-containing protein, partial [Treponema sp.]|nr:helix-turn-helix domain-containing protein [Treponema sp.]
MMEQSQVIYTEENVRRVLRKDINSLLGVAKSLGNELRVEILKKILAGPVHLSELPEIFGLPLSTIATNVKKLEETGLIRTDVIPNTQGSKKICSAVYSGVFLDFSEENAIHERTEAVSLPIGHFSDCAVEPSCGLVSYEKIIGEFDSPASFYDPERVNAQLIWFRRG